MENSFWIPTSISLASLYWNYFQSRKILKLEVEASRKTLIHKFQFEKEFNIYAELWAKLVEVRNSALSLRPVGEIVDARKTEEERKAEKLKHIWKTIFELYETFEKNRPFSSKEIYKEIDDLLRTSKFEAVDFEFGEKQNRKYWDDAKSTAEKIIGTMEKISNLIRKRIEIVEPNV